MVQIDERALVAVLQAWEVVDFAVLFGSATAGALLPMSDVDIGIYVMRDLSLGEWGTLIGHLEEAVGRAVDVVVLNDLPHTHPPMAFESVVKGRLLFARDMNRYVEFKTRCMLAYMDTEPLRRMVNEAFHRRVATGRVGELPRGVRTTETP